MLLIVGDGKRISNPAGFGGRRVKKLLLPPVFDAEPCQAPPGGESVGTQSGGMDSWVRIHPQETLLLRLSCPAPPQRGFVSAAGSLVLLVR